MSNSDMPSALVREASGDAQAEFRSACNTAVLFELDHWTQLELTGSDRAKFLHNFCTNDVRGLTPGLGVEAFLTNVQGKVLAHVFVYARHETLDLFSVPGSAERILAHLSRYQISEDVAFHDASSERGLLLVAGPQAAIALANGGQNVQTLTAGKLRSTEAEEVAGTICRNDFLGIPGFLIACPAIQTSAWIGRLEKAGARRAGSAAFETLRLEACFPLYGIDISEANLAQEVNRTSQAINFSKGCYLGQEPIARIDAMGHVNQQLRGIRLLASGLPVAGAEVFAVEAEPRKIGQITSAALCPETGRALALGYLKRNFDTPGLGVNVATDAGKIAGEVFWPEV